MIAIREATTDDAPALAELRWEFRVSRAAATEERAAFLARCTEWMRRELTAGSRWHAWVALADEAIVGQAWLQTIEKMPNPIAERERHAYISNVFVQPAFRGGVGGRLLDAALAWTAGRNYDRAILWPSSRSVTLYARRGFTRGSEVMERSLASTPR